MALDGVLKLAWKVNDDRTVEWLAYKQIGERAIVVEKVWTGYEKSSYVTLPIYNWEPKLSPAGTLMGVKLGELEVAVSNPRRMENYR